MQTSEWPQVLIEFPDRQSAEQIAASQLRPALAAAQVNSEITTSFFIRKFPHWRVRYQPISDHLPKSLANVLDRLTEGGQILGWTVGIYEPEELAFGGAPAMEVAHELFHQDSCHVLNHLAERAATDPEEPSLGRRELGLLLCSAMMRAAGQDWYEQGDIWAKVAEHRPAQHSPRQSPHTAELTAAAYRLMTVDVDPNSFMLDQGPLAARADWIAAFQHAGEQLAALGRTGRLERGLRAVLAHHVIFSWNRLGLSYAEQHTLATLSRETIMEPQHTAASNSSSSTGAATVGKVPTETTEETTADQLRNELADQLRKQGTVRTPQIDAALRSVPRHLFVPAVPAEQAYADQPVYTHTDSAGVSISAASQPTVVAMMLEQLQPKPGQRVLEIGAGTGYNAALLAHLVGETGHVTTIDVDNEIVNGARSGLAAAGYHDVRVLLGDGAIGHPEGAPYDRVVATVGAWDVPQAWLDQLAPHGRMVIPVRLRGSVSRSIVFEPANTSWRSQSSEMCTFMPLRGIADDARDLIALTEDGAVTLHINKEQTADAEALVGVLQQPRSETWTGVRFGSTESFEWLDLWLTATMPNALSRMPTDQSAITAGLVTPQFGWGAMAVTEKADLAYLTLRPVKDDHEAEHSYEVGVVGHGPSGDRLAALAAHEIRTWDRGYRSASVEFEIQPATAPAPTQGVPGQFVFERPLTRLIVSWRQ